MSKIWLIWKYRKDVLRSLEIIERAGTVTPEILGWHEWCFVGGKKPQILLDGEQYKNDITIKMRMQYHPHPHKPNEVTHD